MTYERQESAYDPIVNAEREATFANKEDWSDVERIQAERDEAVGRGEGATATQKMYLDYRWVEGNVTDTKVTRVNHPILAAQDAETTCAESFARPVALSFGSTGLSDSPRRERIELSDSPLREELYRSIRLLFVRFGSARIQISRITLSKGWPNDAK